MRGVTSASIRRQWRPAALDNKTSSGANILLRVQIAYRASSSVMGRMGARSDVRLFIRIAAAFDVSYGFPHSPFHLPDAHSQV